MWLKIENCFWNGRKHGGKRRKCRLCVFCPFPNNASYTRHLKALWKKEKMLVASIFSCSDVFYTAQHYFQFMSCIYFYAPVFIDQEAYFSAPLAVGQRAYVMARCPLCDRPCGRPCVNFVFKHLLL